MRKAGDTEKLEEATKGFGVFMASYDWEEAMRYAKFTFEDVETVIYAKEGENDGEHWELVVQLKNGKFGWLSAWCDYTGWDCQAGGSSGVEETETIAKRQLGIPGEYHAE